MEQAQPAAPTPPDTPRQLPPELVLRIFEVAASTSTPTEWSKTARKSCLASRGLRDLVQPFLWRYLRYNLTTKGATRLLQAADMADLAAHTRVLELCRIKLYRADAFDAVFAFGSLERLTVQAEVKAAHNLRQLTLASLTLRLDHPLSFPHLTELSLFEITATAASYDHLLSPTTLPSLCALAISRFTDETDEQQYFPHLSPELIARLHALQLTSRDLEHIPQSILESPVPKLLSIIYIYSKEWLTLLRTLSSYSPFAIRLVYRSGVASLVKVLPTLRTEFPPGAPLPLAVFLPTESCDRSIYLHVEDLEKEGEAASVPVVRESNPLSASREWALSLDFLKMAEKLVESEGR
ncbi:hypothetical protein JCM6882_004972 [Rhodosporidiobolus microsporus]